MRVMIAGGGTGGHVIPALAIAQELRSRHGAEVRFVGTARGMETKLVPAAGFPLDLVKVGQLNRVDLVTRMKTLFDLPRAVLQAHRLISDFRPDVMLGVGGYASGPAMLAGAISNTPLIAFEPNFIPGFANRMVAPLVRAAVVQFEATCRNFRNCYVTGVPVREEFFRVPLRPVDARPTLLVFGGSQGAHAINMALLEALPRLAEMMPDILIIHQTGEKDYVDAQTAYLKTMISAEVSPFILDMPGAFARADLIVCRSGASTVAEVTAAGRPAIFIPLPTAADDHQRQNATALADANAARLLRQSELTPDRLAEEVVQLLANRPLLKQMSEAARNLAHPDAAAKIAELTVRASGVAGRGAAVA
jgi:UDP-N-acetylglucosamine--N-acetylmuramyl-(pentapeptide) pyrophosphoryl-undecaprenol N-acetylglucosamine transferase